MLQEEECSTVASHSSALHTCAKSQLLWFLSSNCGQLLRRPDIGYVIGCNRCSLSLSHCAWQMCCCLHKALIQHFPKTGDSLPPGHITLLTCTRVGPRRSPCLLSWYRLLAPHSRRNLQNRQPWARNTISIELVLHFCNLSYVKPIIDQTHNAKPICPQPTT